MQLAVPENLQASLDSQADRHAENPDNPRDSAQGLCIHQLFEAQVERTPDAIAAVFDAQQLTYRQLNARANQLAHHLRSLGVAPEVRVALCVDASVEMLVGVLAVLKAGGAYVPIDPDTPEARIAFMLSDAAPRVVLTLRNRPRPPSSLSIPSLFLDEPASCAHFSTENPVLRASPANLAYVIYTSGSTGLPKAVSMPHAAVVNHCQSLGATAFQRPPMRVACLAPVVFDASVPQLFGTLAHGHTLYPIDASTRRDPDLLVAFLHQYQIALTDCTPSQLATLVDAGLGREPHRSLHTILCGGEALPSGLLRSLFDAYQGAPLTVVNVYGPTEYCVDAAALPITSQRVDDRYPTAPLGAPLQNTQLYILDPQLNPVPIGVAGELHIAGTGLARGYLNQPELTAVRFIPDPFSEQPGARLYKTGDLARFLPDGNIQFLGRIDHQVKLRGYRIELGEIESVLCAHPLVRSAVVVLREDAPGDKRLCAYVVLSEEGPLDAQKLRAHLAAKLPDYMLPAAFVPLPALPLTENGKVDRMALPAPSFVQNPDSFVPPQTPTEQLLADLFAAVLNLPRVGRHDDFFALGGDSILSIQVVSRATHQGLSLSVKQLFQNPTPARLASVAAPAPATVPSPALPTGPVPITPIAAWLLDSPDSVPHHFNQSAVLELDVDIQLPLLHDALAAVHALHDAFALRFVRTESGWEQSLDLAASRFSLVQISLPDTPDEQANAAQLEARATDLHASFDLARGPLSKLLLLSGTPDEPPLLLWVVHHLAVDGVSWRILLSELAQTYAALCSGRTPSLPPPATPFSRWAALLASHAHAPSLRAERPHWLSVLSASPRLPVDQAQGDNSVASSETRVATLDPQTTGRLIRAVAAAHGANLGEALLAALSWVLSSERADAALRIDVESYGRETELFPDVDLSRTVGWFTSMYPVRIPLHHASPFSALPLVKEALRQTPHLGLGFGLLRYLARDAQLLSALAASGDSELCFNYLGVFDSVDSAESARPPFTLLNESFGQPHSPLHVRPYLIDIDAVVQDRQLQVVWTYSRTGHHPETIARWSDALLAALHTLLREAEETSLGGYTPSDFPLCGLSQAALDRALSSLGIRGRTGVQDVYPLSPMQYGMLFHSLLQPGSAIYYEQTTLYLAGSVDPDALRTAFEHLVAQQPVLRTAFALEQDPAVQIVVSSCAVPWAQHDFSARTADDAEHALSDLCSQRQQQGFSPRRAPLLRVDLVRLPAQRWALILAFHHALLDGWSTSRLFAQLGATYQACVQGTALPTLSGRSLRDFVEYLQQQDTAAAASYYRVLLGDVTAPSALPGRRPPTDRTTVAQTASCSLSLSPAHSAQLTQLTRAHGVTPNCLLQAAWAVVLGRMTRSEDILIGATVSGRPPHLPQIEERLGLFINTLPVRIRFRPRMSLLDLARQVQAEQLEARDHEALPLVIAQRCSQIPAGQPLFDCVFVFENYPLEEQAIATLGGLQLEGIQSQEQTHYALTFVAFVAETWEMRAEYDSTQFEAGAVERALKSLNVLLDRFVQSPQRGLYDLPLLTEDERQQILVRWNDTRQDFPQDLCIHQLFEAQVEKTPDAVAVAFEEQQLTYQQLNARANQLAHHLRSLGVGPEVRVALCVERSLEMIVGLFGILKAGGAYVPIDPAFPQARIAFMLEDAEPYVVLTRCATRSRLPDASPMTLCLDEPGGWVHCSVRNPQPRLSPLNLAYVIYTSGSTGQPKGVQISHRSLLHATNARPAFYGSCIRKFLLLSSLAFDSSIAGIFWSLSAGASLLLPKAGAERDPQLIAALIETHTPSHVVCTPSLYRSLLQLEDATRNTLLHATIILGGEAVEAPLADMHLQRHPDSLLFNEYGPTEATVWSSVHPVRSDDDLLTDLPAVPIGRPITNTQLYILDPQLNPVPIGVPGEIHIGGMGLARGYLNQPDLTAFRFIPDPFSQQPGARLYKTGDLARFLPDGNIQFLGRIDHQIKLRGYRIELGEIESVLCTHPRVRSAVVLLREDAPGDKRLCAYVVLSEEDPLDAQKLRAHLSARLPDYMLPAAFVPLPALPLTPNGKLDRKALPAPSFVPNPDSFVPPQTPTEQILADLFAAVLNLPRVGRHDDFFALGGHSLLATQLVARIRSALALELPLRQLFATPSVSALAAYLSQHQSVPTLPPLIPAPRDPFLPLSSAQQRLFFLDQLEPARALYNLPLALHLRGFLDVEALQRAFLSLIDRHESLRTSFPTRDGIAHQRIAPPPASPGSLVSILSIDPDPPESIDAALLRLAAAEAQTPFDLSTGPLFRVCLLRASDRHHVLLLTMHHIISDGWSLSVLLREIQALYTAFRRGLPSPLAPLPCQVPDVALWERELLRGDFLSPQLAYWRQQLAALEPLSLPTDHPRPPLFSHRGRSLPVSVPADRVRALKHLALDHGATLFMALLAVFQTLLARYSGQTDIAVGSPFAHRTHAETESLLGFFVNTLVLRSQIDLQRDFVTLLHHAREVCLSAFAHQDVPFERLVSLLHVERDLSRAPLFQVMLVLQNEPQEELHLPDLVCEPLEVENQTAKFELTLALTELADGTLDGELEYACDLWEAATIERLWGHFLVLLTAIVDNPKRPLAKLPLLSETERQQQLWQRTPSAADLSPGPATRSRPSDGAD